jgi:hypothetical protein
MLRPFLAVELVLGLGYYTNRVLGTRQGCKSPGTNMITVALFVLIAFILVALPPLIASLFFDFVRKDTENSNPEDWQEQNGTLTLHSRHGRFALQTRFTYQEAKSNHWRSRFGKI